MKATGRIQTRPPTHIKKLPTLALKVPSGAVASV
jgi:hypothetical protein